MDSLQLLLAVCTLLLVADLYRKSSVTQRVPKNGGVVIDTSALIDGRLQAVATSGFLQGRVIVPTTVVDELQLLADGKDAYKRSRARGGLEELASLESMQHLALHIAPVTHTNGADADVLELASKCNAALCTTDYALLKRAEAMSIRTMNINLLASTLQVQISAGDILELKIEKIGEQKTQGVGHAEDGSLCVVEGAAQYVGNIVRARIKHISQTKSGRVIFALIIL